MSDEQGRATKDRERVKMTATAKQRDALDLYCKVMEETKVRLSWIDLALKGNTQLPDVAKRDFCFLQLRMICELIALGCLIAHGDIARTTAIRKEYAADKIVAQLEKLHSQFYPMAVEPGPPPMGIPPIGLEFHVLEHGYLSKPELSNLYRQCGDVLHRASLKKFLSTATFKTDLKDVKDWRDKIIKLLRLHLICMLDNRTVFFVTASNPQAKGRPTWMMTDINDALSFFGETHRQQ
jgi:hypothetical protein